MPATAFWGDSLTAGMLNSTDTPPVFGANLWFDGGISGETAQQIAARMIADTTRRTWNQVIWAGQNWTTEQDLKDYVDAAIASLSHSRYLVISVINAGMTAVDQEPAGSRYLGKMGANTYFANRYGTKFLDLHGQLVDYGVSIANAQSVDYDAPPSTYQPVDIHLTGPGGYAFCNQKVFEKLTALGYMTPAVMATQIAASGGRGVQ